MPTPSRSTASATGFSRVFAKTRPDIDVHQVTQFTFAGHELRVSDTERFELMLFVEPAYSATLGLGWSMTFSGHLCLENSCQTLFETKLPRELSARLAVSKAPLALASSERSELIELSIRKFPGLSDALGAALAQLESKDIEQSTSTVAPKSHKTSL